MEHSTQNQTNRQHVRDPLTELIREGARQLIAQAVEAELQLLLQQESPPVDGKRSIIRNGYLPKRTIQTGAGDVEVQIPKVRDRSGRGIKFNSNLVPPYLKRTREVEEFLPWLYLKGVSTGDFHEALRILLGENAHGLSSATIGRLKQDWIKEQETWSRRDLSNKQYVYWWADGIYFNIRADNDRECMLIIMGALPDGTKELVAIEDGFRESEQSWTELLQNLRSRGLQKPPSLATGDGALGFWKAMSKVFPQARHQRCWVHKTANILNKVPKSVRSKFKKALHEIWMALTREEAYEAFDRCIARFRGQVSQGQRMPGKGQRGITGFL